MHADMATNAGPEEVTLDENLEATQHKFYMTGAVTVSPRTTGPLLAGHRAPSPGMLRIKAATSSYFVRLTP